MNPSEFLFAVCQLGAEATLKKEIQKRHPNLHFAYSRPGFVTFKSEKPLPVDFELQSIFARAYGLSFGKKKDTGEILKTVLELFPQQKMRLHVWETDKKPSGKDKADPIKKGERAEKIRKDLLDSDLSKHFLKDPLPHLGDIVVDVITLSDQELWMGAHTHTPDHSRFPGGNPGIELPTDAPSRAYLKLEDALANFPVTLTPTDTAVEIGSAPGGGSYSLLKRGLKIIGIDPGEMDPKILAFGRKRFKHYKCPVAEVPPGEIPPSVEWIFLDMNSAPHLAIPPLERMANTRKDTLLGVFLTLKLNEWSLAERIPNYLERIEKIGIARFFCRQLAANAQEVTVIGLTQKGLTRLKAAD